jgi:hypothetical protein
MVEPAYGSRHVEAKRSAVVSATSEEVREVAADWAQGLGWEPVANGGAFAAFKLGHSIFSTGIEMEVGAYTSRGSTRVQFLARAGRSPDSDWDNDMQRAAETFANGVLHELRLCGATVDPARLATARVSRESLRARERLRKWVEWGLVALFVPVPVLVWFLTHDAIFTLAAPLWIIGAILGTQFARMRANGIHARLQVVGVLILVVGIALGLTIAGAVV